MESNESPVSHVDLYHKLGRMEALLETMMSNLGAFQAAIKDIHVRIDAMEARQNRLERASSSANGATSALTGLIKDFAIPILAVAVTWLVARGRVEPTMTPRHLLPAPQHQTSQTGTIEATGKA